MFTSTTIFQFSIPICFLVEIIDKSGYSATASSIFHILDMFPDFAIDGIVHDEFGK